MCFNSRASGDRNIVVTTIGLAQRVFKDFGLLLGYSMPDHTVEWNVGRGTGQYEKVMVSGMLEASYSST